MGISSGAGPITRSRTVPWLIASGATAAGLALLVGAAWFLGPIWFPGLTVRYSPWIGPAMRAAIRQMPALGGIVQNPLPAWAGDSSRRWIAIISYAHSPDFRERMVAMASLFEMHLSGPRPEIDASLSPLLRDHKPGVRKIAVMALTDRGSIPLLEAMGTDPDPEVAQEVAEALRNLRPKAGTAAR